MKGARMIVYYAYDFGCPPHPVPVASQGLYRSPTQNYDVIILMLTVTEGEHPYCMIPNTPPRWDPLKKHGSPGFPLCQASGIARAQWPNNLNMVVQHAMFGGLIFPILSDAEICHQHLVQGQYSLMWYWFIRVFLDIAFVYFLQICNSMDLVEVGWVPCFDFGDEDSLMAK